jgi:hypothetical protein
MDATLKSFLYVYFAQPIHQSHIPLRLKVRKIFTLLGSPLTVCAKNEPLFKTSKNRFFNNKLGFIIPIYS